MVHMTVKAGDGAADDLVARGLKAVHIGNDAPPIRIGYLSGGMASGKPSLAFIFELPDGERFVIAETSAALFLSAADIVRAWCHAEGIDL